MENWYTGTYKFYQWNKGYLVTLWNLLNSKDRVVAYVKQIRDWNLIVCLNVNLCLISFKISEPLKTLMSTMNWKLVFAVWNGIW